MSSAALLGRWHDVEGLDVYRPYLTSDEPLGGLEDISSPAPAEASTVNWLNIFYAAEWAVFAGFAFYLWYRLARDAWEKELEDLEDAGARAARTRPPSTDADARHARGRRPGAPGAYSRAVTKSVSILILGAGGDLTKRLLLPGLASLLSVHDYDVQVLGAAREERTDEEWRQLIRDSFGQITDPGDADRYLESARYIVTARRHRCRPRCAS